MSTDPEQLRALTVVPRSGGDDAAVLIDQEGGRVQRLGPPHWPAYPPAAVFGRMGDPRGRAKRRELSARLMAQDLRAVGVNVDCLPVLDVAAPDTHAVIGDRAYADDPGRGHRVSAAPSRAGCSPAG